METLIENGKTNVVVIQEKREKYKELMEKFLEKRMVSCKGLVEGLPDVLKAIAVFGGKDAELFRNIAEFFKTPTGKRILAVLVSGEEITGENLKGNKDEAIKKAKDELYKMLKEGIDKDQIKKDIEVIFKKSDEKENTNSKGSMDNGYGK